MIHQHNPNELPSLASRCYESGQVEMELFDKVNEILGCDTENCTKEGFVWGAFDVGWDEYDSSVEVIRPESEWMMAEQASQIIDLGFWQIYETCGDKARCISKSGTSFTCSPREPNENTRLRAKNQALINTIIQNKDLLLEASQALQDWITTYASEFCDGKIVEETWNRISNKGGTLYYAGELSQRLREAAQK